MKRIVLIFPALLLALSLAGCSLVGGLLGGILVNAPKSVEIDGRTYKSGFYGDLWPHDYHYTGEDVEINGRLFHHLDCEQFDLYHASVGTTANGTIYCLESQWKDARAYYADEANFAYICELNAKFSSADHEYYPIEDMDREQFEALMNMGGTFVSNLLDPVQQKVGELKQTTIYRDRQEVSTIFRFYKESTDGIFCTCRGYYFFLCEGKMYLMRAHHMQDNTYSAIEVDAELAAPFIAIVEGLLES